MTGAVSIIAFAAVAIAAAWPYIVRHRTASDSGLSASAKASWVNQLFALADKADADGLTDIASAARALIAALVKKPDRELSRRG
jgi:hypothetical protein